MPFLSNTITHLECFQATKFVLSVAKITNFQPPKISYVLPVHV